MSHFSFAKLNTKSGAQMPIGLPVDARAQPCLGNFYFYEWMEF